ncbi:hypothetical protein [Phytohabitans rumicis]|uniref:Membrane protein n=1 Tax=Phytohabitans rumicis TaxID=1076125 RepID=A0A6V8L6R4_9ACTN|nr:hypothetical protein [Phytohabitans rumicis]GFJ91240.1 membrane protein [Phytohabitans rumicis]
MAQPQTRRQPPALAVAALIALAVVAFQALLVPLFAAPAANLEPRDLPVIVAGPAPAADGLAANLERARPGAFDISTEPDAASADAALRDHEAYAAFVVGADGVTLHTASGASPTVATLLTQATQQLSGGQQVRVVDVVPTDVDDPRGAGFAAGFLPLAMTALAAGALAALVLRSRGQRLLALGTFATLAGLVVSAVLQFWLGILPDNYLLNAAAMSLFALAASATVAGLGSALGKAGVGLGALVVFLVSNPLSAVSAAPELLPEPWGAVGQWLPVGAGSTLLRSTAYFDGAGGGMALWVLAGYAVVGLALVALSRTGRPERVTPMPVEREAVPVG